MFESYCSDTKYDWLYNPHNMTHKQKLRFKSLRESTLKTARAWVIKELVISLWHYVSKTWVQKGWDRWLSWAVRTRLDPIKEVAKTIKAHLWGILNAVVLKVSNGPAEGLNSRIKIIKFRSRGFRNSSFGVQNAVNLFQISHHSYSNCIVNASS
ncbi:MAG: transposase [Candidatus Thiodiazotropha sp. (ex Lucinoma aequizonata)]|nr:transposase [Candidatus Thiodiazotropha sp. (ex Lucinoma aequizonata)]MCU7895494.1 transposase [Candidatus Thiodiazotropha sp. (ex Lucinoma aequizonata)]MCU7897699.1 transposase [Candidatus Thiodiazotropha sp. (ex Lucinoma aequizonata)]MCU7900635.1 transposase [Candidatus Thiodiazotropha sp. (ex Lucinoma aequizonata)]MCU7912614.1 transposase [Candidatus Thiodiazotropha sp. (ex Lucinoma aequizonata)]